MPRYYDRYEQFRYNGKMSTVPGVKIAPDGGDKTVVYKIGETRLDKLSNTYYNTPYYGWLILLANPQFGGLEFTIPDQSIITIPFPFESAIGRYRSEINKYKALYGG